MDIKILNALYKQSLGIRFVDLIVKDVNAAFLARKR